MLFARRSILNLHHFVNAIDTYCSESCIKLRHVSLKIHLNLHYSSFDPLYASVYFQLVFTFKHILRKGIDNSSLQCFSDPRKGINNASLRCFTDHVKESITHRPTWSRNSPISQSLRAECPRISCMGGLAPGPNPLNTAAH